MSGDLFLVAHVGGRGFLFDVRDLDSVVDLPTVVRAPGAAGAVAGLVALRSRVATVIDLRVLLGLPVGGAAGGRRAVVVAVEGHLYALAVDTLEEVAAFTLDAAPVVDGTDGWAAVSGLADGEGEILCALDAARLVAAVRPGGVNQNLTAPAAEKAGPTSVSVAA